MIFYCLTIRFISVFYKLENTFLLPGLPVGGFLRLIKSSKTAIKGGGNQYRCDEFYKRRPTTSELSASSDIKRGLHSTISP
jgi:hypothetical protein